MINDGLPNNVCLQCVHHINSSFSFKQLCERSENTLRDLLGRPLSEFRQSISQQTNKFIHSEQTFLELKPLLVGESLVSNSVNEIISGVTETLEPPLPPVSETLSNVGEEAVPLQPPEEILENVDHKFEHKDNDLKVTLREIKESINDVFTERGDSMNMKFEDFENNTECK